MKTPIILTVVALLIGVAAMHPASAETRDEKWCQGAIKDTEQAVKENPSPGAGAEAAVRQTMELAKKRCLEKDYSQANELLILVRSIVVTE